MTAKKELEMMRKDELRLYVKLESLVDLETVLIAQKKWNKIFEVLKKKQKIIYKINVLEASIKKQKMERDFMVEELMDVIKRVMKKQSDNEAGIIPYMSELKLELKGFSQQKKLQKTFGAQDKQGTTPFSLKS